MFFFLKYNRKQSQNSQNLEQDRLAQHWVNKCLRAQDSASSFLQAKSEKLSLGSKKLLLITFCLISFSSCVYLVINSIFHNPSFKLSIAAIPIPKQVTQNERRQIKLSNALSKQEFEQVKKFRVYIDSLANSNSGRKKYDSIMNYRPGLIDSLIIIEKFYKSQSSKK